MASYGSGGASRDAATIDSPFAERTPPRTRARPHLAACSIRRGEEVSCLRLRAVSEPRFSRHARAFLVLRRAHTDDLTKLIGGSGFSLSPR